MLIVKSHSGLLQAPERSWKMLNALRNTEAGRIALNDGYHIPKPIKMAFKRLKFKNEINDLFCLDPHNLTQNLGLMHGKLGPYSQHLNPKL